MAQPTKDHAVQFRSKPRKCSRMSTELEIGQTSDQSISIINGNNELREALEEKERLVFTLQNDLSMANTAINDYKEAIELQKQRSQLVDSQAEQSTKAVERMAAQLQHEGKMKTNSCEEVVAAVTEIIHLHFFN